MPALGWFARELLHLHIQAVSHDMAGNVDSVRPPVNTFLPTKRYSCERVAELWAAAAAANFDPLNPARQATTSTVLSMDERH